MLALLCRIHDVLEHCRFVLGQVRERFAVEANFFFRKGVDELAVCRSKFARHGVDFDIPEAAERALLGAAVAEGVGAGFEYCRFGELDF